MVFTATKDNHITAFESLKEAKCTPGTEPFASLKELSELAAHWPASRLIEIWNNLPGIMPVKKFTDRKTAVARIWKALQQLKQSAPVAIKQAHASDTVSGTMRVETREQGKFDQADGRTQRAGESRGAATQPADTAPVVQRSTHDATAQSEELRPPAGGTKADTILAMLNRNGGATFAGTRSGNRLAKAFCTGLLGGNRTQENAFERHIAEARRRGAPLLNPSLIKSGTSLVGRHVSAWRLSLLPRASGSRSSPAFETVSC